MNQDLKIIKTVFMPGKKKGKAGLKSGFHRITFEPKSKKDITCGETQTKKSSAYGRGFKPNFSGTSSLRQ